MKNLSDRLPDGFEATTSEGRTVVFRSSNRDQLDALGVFERDRMRALTREAETVAGGRGGAVAVPFENGRAIIRHCRRGGILGRLTGDRYLLGARPVEELCVTESARAGGVPAPEPLAAIVRRRTFGYSGDLVVREIPRATALDDWLAAEADPAGLAVVIERLADAFSRLVKAGIYHPDLHPGNVLVRGDGDPELFLIDFDRAEHVEAGLGENRRNRMLFRFNRALVKRGLAPRPVTLRHRAQFVRASGVADDADARRRLFADCAAHLRRHAWHYRRNS